MGITLLAAGKTEEAIVHFNESLRMKANQAEVYVNLGKANSQLGKYESAIQNWTRALELKPDSVDVLNNLAWLLATLARYP